MSEALFIPVDSLDASLRELIPFGEKIIYTSKAKVSKPGWGQPTRHGDLILTPSGVAFKAGEGQSKTDIFEDYVPYTHMTEVKSKKGTLEFKIKNPTSPEIKRGWKLTLERVGDEDKKAFKKREELFTQTFEDLMKRRLAIYF